MTKIKTKMNRFDPCPFNKDITCEKSSLLTKYKEEIDKRKLWNRVISFTTQIGKYPLLSCCDDCVYCPTKPIYYAIKRNTFW